MAECPMSNSCRQCGFESREPEAACPECGTWLDARYEFGGLTIDYDSSVDCFELRDRHQPLARLRLDNADVPEALMFMLLHFRFEGWEHAYRGLQGIANLMR